MHDAKSAALTRSRKAYENQLHNDMQTLKIPTRLPEDPEIAA
jgi:hypothetical protein